MKIGLLQVGKVADELLDKYEEFPPFFETLFAEVAPALTFHRYNILRGEKPGLPEECDGWLISGSARGVYDDDPWIAETRDFLLKIRAAGRPLVGVCFGHQLMAEAFGGAAGLSDKGWGCGVHEYEVHHRPSWMADAPGRIALHAMHRDQVTALPEDATVLASNPFCEIAMVAYGDPDHPDAVSIQPHPEFERPFAEDLVKKMVEPVVSTLFEYITVFFPEAYQYFHRVHESNLKNEIKSKKKNDFLLDFDQEIEKLLENKKEKKSASFNRNGTMQMIEQKYIDSMKTSGSIFLKIQNLKIFREKDYEQKVIAILESKNSLRSSQKI